MATGRKDQKQTPHIQLFLQVPVVGAEGTGGDAVVVEKGTFAPVAEAVADCRRLSHFRAFHHDLVVPAGDNPDGGMEDLVGPCDLESLPVRRSPGRVPSGLRC